MIPGIVAAVRRALDLYTYRVFTSSGSFFVPGDVTTVDALIVAGGGGGGSRQGGGGGAGGVRLVEGQSVTPGASITVTVGAGGNGGTSGNAGAPGSNSAFGALTATGGGRGGSRSDSTSGGNGGSGGGGSMNNAGTAPTSGGTGTAGQGNAGGAGHQDESGTQYSAGGGGGGASEVGQTAPGVIGDECHAGDGGDGVSLASIGWSGAIDEGAPSSVGGGGGGGAFSTALITGVPGTGGLGGGGDGGLFDDPSMTQIAAPQAGTPNTGGGGGGGGASAANGATGGSGIVIVRYLRSAFDQYFSSVQLLCGFNGADGATSSTDESSTQRSMTFVGNAQIDTAQFKFGPSSLLLDGSGDYVSIADNAALELSNSDFTIEAWVRFDGDPSSDQCIISKYLNTGNQRSWAVRCIGGSLLEFLYSTDGASNTTLQSAWDPDGNTWHHVAVCRQGANLRLFADGALLGTHNIGTATIFNSTEAISIGRINSSGFDNNYLDGWLDEVRLTIGQARYSSSFAVPTAPFPRAAAA